MNSETRNNADVLKNHSVALNPGLDPHPLIRKPQRVRLSESAKKSLRTNIHDKKPMVLCGKPPTLVTSVDDVKKEGIPNEKSEAVKAVMNVTQPLVLATASDWVLSGSDMSRVIYDVRKEEKSTSAVRLLNSDELGNVVREGRMENPTPEY